MIILAIESTTNICSVAVSKGGKLAGYMEEDIPQRQLTWIMPAIDKLIKKSKIKYKDINYIAVTNGPGSYTGLRLGIITAKTIAQILDIPILAYNTLEALAYNCVDSRDIICAVLDAKKNEIYAGVFIRDGKNLKQILPPKAYNLDRLVCDINAINKMVAAGFLVPTVGQTFRSAKSSGSLRKQQILFTGTALYKYKDELSAGLKIKHKFAPKKLWHPKASALCVMAHRDIGEGKAKLLNYVNLEAFYLREPDIGTNRKQFAVSE